MRKRTFTKHKEEFFLLLGKFDAGSNISSWLGMSSVTILKGVISEAEYKTNNLNCLNQLGRLSPTPPYNTGLSPAVRHHKV